MTINNDDEGKFGPAGEIRFQRLLPGPLERVWAYLTDPEKRGRWLAAGAMELRVGGKVELIFDHASLTPPREDCPDTAEAGCPAGQVMTGRITRCVPPRLLSYTWGESDGQDSEVTFELTPQSNRVLLVLIHRRLGGDRAVVASIGAGWHTHVAILLAKLEGAPPPPFWATHSRLESAYQKQLSLLATPPANP